MTDVRTVCCKKCDPCYNCYDDSTYRLRDLLYAIDKNIADAADAQVCSNEWGPTRGCRSNEDIDKMITYKGVINRYYRAVKSGLDPTLCPEDIQKIIDKVKKLVKLSCIDEHFREDQYIDDSNYKYHLAANPTCAVFEDWERNLCDTVIEVGISATRVKDTCDFTLNVKSVKDPLKVLKAISTYTKCKELKVQAKANYKECNIQYTALSRLHNCKFDLNAYTKLIECGFTYKAISDIHECGLKLSYNSIKKCPELHYDAKSSVSLCDLNVNIFSEDVNCKLLSTFVGVDVCSNLDNPDIIEL